MTGTPPIRAEEHLGLVWTVLKRFRRRAEALGYDAKDLAQEGFVALSRCALKHEPTRGAFSTLAYLSVLRAMNEALNRHRRVQQLPEAELPDPEAADPAAGMDVAELLQVLSPRDRHVVELRYGLVDGQEHTLDQVGGELGVTGERARQLLARALRRMREAGIDQTF